MRRRSFAMWCVAALLATTVALVPAEPAAAQAPAVIINEFLAANENNLADNTGEFEDWIELRNTSGSTVNLAGWKLSDGGKTFTFPAGFSLPGGAYSVLFASNAPGRTTASELHLPFKLSADGEPLELRTNGGQLSQPSWSAPGFPALPVDVSYGRTNSGSLAYFTAPTPGSANGGGAGGLVAAVSFSVPHGYYSSTQTVTLNTATSAATIRYTLDGSTPTTSHGSVLSPGQSISVSSTSTVRAVAYRSGWIASAPETRSYLFTSDIVNQSTLTPPGWPNSGLNGQRMHYGMDPDIVSGNESTIAASLTSIPTLSVVTDLPNLVSSSTGIYTNAQQSGINWERPASVELIDPTGADPGFDINAGLRIRGGGSRIDDNPKHSFRLYFRDTYGDGNLEYPLFGPAGPDTFESLGLPTGQHGSWQFRSPADATWVREMWSRDTQRDMGQPYTRSQHYHLYLNGQYWGLYYSQERISNGYGETHFGGNEGDYDVITSEWRSAGSATDGTIDAWESLYPMVSDLNITTNEFTTLDGVVDMENLADYYVLHYFSGDWDGSPMGWQSNGVRWADSNNWRALRNRAGVGAAGKWLFFDHDSEFTFCIGSSTEDTDNSDWNLTSGTVPNHQTPTPAWLHQALLSHPAYQQIFRDRVALHMQTAGGALTVPIAQARLDARVATMSGAIDAEAARWGDSLSSNPYDRGDWTNAVAELRSCIANRFSIVQSQLANAGLWPSDNPPSITPPSGAVPYGSSVTIDKNGETGTLWVTTDGADPRAANGSPAPSAFVYGGPLTITAATTIRARVVSGSAWTPLAQAAYTLSSPAGPVRLGLNEYNAVSATKFLGGGAAGDIANGSDETFGRMAGNGGDWFELAVIEDGLDIRGWKIEVWHLDTGLPELSATLEFANSAVLADLQTGSLITVSEDIADDIAYAPTADDWHINLQANDAGDGAHFTAASQSNFATDKDDTQIAIFDETGAPVALRTGEGTVPGVSISSEEIFKLEATPTIALTFDSADYNDGTTSTWGLPNRWANGSVLQDLGRVLLGDVTCNGSRNVNDALAILQYSVGTRTAAPSCPLPDPINQIWLPAADVSGDTAVNVNDALMVLQCSVGQTNSLCP